MNYLIIGCGPMGAGVAGALARTGHAVALVDKNAAALAHLEPQLRPHLTVGSAFDRDILERAGIEKADGLAAMTHSDECNVVTARLARLVFQVPRVVARLCDPRKVEIYRRLGIQVATPLSWSVNRFVELLSYSELEAVVSLGHGDVEIVQVEVNPFLDGRTVSALTVPGEARVVAVSRAGKTFLPSGETLLRCDDVAHIAVLADSVERLRTILALP